jgi:hypothetical protein
MTASIQNLTLFCPRFLQTNDALKNCAQVAHKIAQLLFPKLTEFASKLSDMLSKAILGIEKALPDILATRKNLRINVAREKQVATYRAMMPLSLRPFQLKIALASAGRSDRALDSWVGQRGLILGIASDLIGDNAYTDQFWKQLPSKLERNFRNENTLQKAFKSSIRLCATQSYKKITGDLQGVFCYLDFKSTTLYTLGYKGGEAQLFRKVNEQWHSISLSLYPKKALAPLTEQFEKLFGDKVDFPKTAITSYRLLEGDVLVLGTDTFWECSLNDDHDTFLNTVIRDIGKIPLTYTLIKAKQWVADAGCKTHFAVQIMHIY